MGKLFLNAVNVATCMHTLSDINTFATCTMYECNLHTLTLFDFYAYICMWRASMHVFYLQKPVLVNMAVPICSKWQCQKKMWALLSGVCEADISLPILDIYFT